MNRVHPGLSIVVCLIAGVALAEDARPSVARSVAPFFTANCYECHDADSAKGGLNLQKIAPDLSSLEQLDQWTKVYDRVAKGEMPPPKEKQPARPEVDAFLSVVRPALIQADRSRRHVVQRRLNRQEYQNTIADLLAIDIDVRAALPQDQQAGGFDNNGEALAISTEQLQAYMDAARRAVDAAVLVGHRPTTETFVGNPAAEIPNDIKVGDVGSLDGRVVMYLSDTGDYSKVAVRTKRPKVRGRYHIKFDAVACYTQGRQSFTVTSAGSGEPGTASRNLGYFDVGPEPKTFEVDALLDAHSTIQFFAFGLPKWVKAMPDPKYPGLGIGKVEITGPLIDQWPPASYTQLLGAVDLAKGTIADAKAVLARFMPRAFRRPVTDAEVERYTALVQGRLDAGRTFSESLRTGLVAVLCSPNFIYLREEARPADPRVTDTELAARLSYFLWNTMPDAELLALAERHQLADPVTLRTQVDRLLNDPRRDTFITSFTGQWMRLRLINDTQPDEKFFGKFDDLLRVSMVREGEGFFREMLVHDLPVVNFLDSDWTMLNQRLAEHYGIPGVTGVDMRKVPLPPDSVRGGILTQAGVLKVTANGTTTSPVLRGVWVLENILGEPNPPPPPNVGGIEPDIRGATTIREQLDKHRHVQSCNVCHQRIDPPGFALESFDPVGDYRERYLRWHVTNVEKGYGNVEQGAAVDPSGRLATGETFRDVREFKRLLLARQDRFATCLTGKLLTYALGREMGFSDRDAIAKIIASSDSTHRGLRSLIHSIAESETFATR